MKSITYSLLTVLTMTASLFGEGFTDSNVIFYGKVRQMDGAQAVLLQSGKLKLTFSNAANKANRVVLESNLAPTGSGDDGPYSYALKVPLAYLPTASRLNDYLAIGADETPFVIESITIDGVPATLPDTSREFYGLSFANRADQYRLDLLVEGDSQDADQDGLPDAWETRYGLDPSDARDADRDDDGDGWTNLEEYRRGSHPSQSNTEPHLTTSEIQVPELGEAGLFIQVLDADTASDHITFDFDGVVLDGFELKLDGVPWEATSLTLADLENGRLTMAHTDREKRGAMLPLSWSDGVTGGSSDLLVTVSLPSSEAGNDATLWLDGTVLPEEGTLVSQWSDRSGNARHASQPSTENRPVVRQQSVDFSASSSAHLFLQDDAISSQDHTVMVAYQAAATSATSQTLFASNRGHFEIAPTTQALSYPGAPVYQMNQQAVGGYESMAGRRATSIFRAENGLLQNIFGLSYDGAEREAETIAPVLPTIGLRRSATRGATLSEPFGGRLHELIVFASALPEQRLRDVHDYLQSKWSDAVIWDHSTNLSDVRLHIRENDRPQIIRGGLGNDDLAGGAGDDTLSGGPGSDILTGGEGHDRFVYGGVDTGTDVIADFDLEEDILDLSAFFWGVTGDARDHLSVRLDSNFATEVPSLDSVLVVRKPDSTELEITLRDTIIDAEGLIQLVVEGRLRMGGLSIPMELELASKSLASVRENESFSVELTRRGAGVAAAMEVPLGYFQEALGEEIRLVGAEGEGQLASVPFARGETSKTLTFQPRPDLESEGSEIWEVAILPGHRYDIAGDAVRQTVRDLPNVRLEVLRSNAMAAAPALVRLHRDGDAEEALTLDLTVSGTARAGEHIEPLPSSLTIPPNQQSVDLTIQTLPELPSGLSKIAVLKLTSREHYQLGAPHEAVISVSATEEAGNQVRFAHWLTTHSDGEIANLKQWVDLSSTEKRRFLMAYAFEKKEGGAVPITFRINDQRPEFVAKELSSAADLSWGVQVSGELETWEDASSAFVEVATADGLRLVGPPTDPSEERKFYRINFQVEAADLVESQLEALAKASRYGISGTSRWESDPINNTLKGFGGDPHGVSRILVEVLGPTTLDFEMAINDATTDRLTFFVNGIRLAETVGAATQVAHELTDPGAHLLMWEFHHGSGEAIIRNR